jgi:hypothetical protein
LGFIVAQTLPSFSSLDPVSEQTGNTLSSRNAPEQPSYSELGTVVEQSDHPSERSNDPDTTNTQHNASDAEKHISAPSSSLPSSIPASIPASISSSNQRSTSTKIKLVHVKKHRAVAKVLKRAKKSESAAILTRTRCVCRESIKSGTMMSS